jgi:hypothetical protein
MRKLGITVEVPSCDGGVHARRGEVKGVVQMRSLVVKPIVVLLGILALSSALLGQGRGGRPLPPGYIYEGVPKMPDPIGPAPKQDLNGAWVGPQNLVMGPFPAMTPAGEAAFKLNKPIMRASDRATQVEANNDPFMICDPLGFPRDLLNHALSSRGGMWFEQVSNRMLILYEQQRVWREAWMDGRDLPKKVDARGAPDSRYYGYSVGHWDGDYTFVIDTVGVTDKAWLDEAGRAHTVDAHFQERYTRKDQYNLEVTVTIDDPKFYTQPFQVIKADYYWMKNQNVEEELCIPSQALEYRDRLATPSGWGAAGAPAK